MSKILEIEELLNKWKADSKQAYDDGDFEYEKLAMDRTIALESALAILKRPSNTRMQTEPCSIKDICLQYVVYNNKACEQCVEGVAR